MRNRQRGERELEKEAERSEGVGERGREVRGVGERGRGVRGSWRKRQGGGDRVGERGRYRGGGGRSWMSVQLRHMI